MRYRMMDANGDYTFGQNGANFFVNTPAAVAQAVQTRLKLIEGEWFLDTSAGTPYNSLILGAGTIGTYDAAIQGVILNSPGVTGIANYASTVDPITRKAVVTCTIDTQYGTATVQSTL